MQWPFGPSAHAFSHVTRRRARFNGYVAYRMRDFCLNNWPEASQSIGLVGQAHGPRKVSRSDLLRHHGLRLGQRVGSKKGWRFFFDIESRELTELAQGPSPITFGIAQSHYDYT